MGSDSELLQAIPDLPEWLCARGMLLGRDCDVVGGSDPDRGVILVGRTLPVVFVIGQPDETLLYEVASNAPDDVEILCVERESEWLQHRLTSCRFEWATLYVAGSAALPDPANPMGMTTTQFTTKHLSLLDDLEDVLATELRNAWKTSSDHFAITFCGGRPASFCYAPWVSESFWDVAIETVEPLRRQGCGSCCARFMFRHMRERGKSPVWGAVESNFASRRMAEKLGLQVAGRLGVFTKQVTA